MPFTVGNKRFVFDDMMTMFFVFMIEISLKVTDKGLLIGQLPTRCNTYVCASCIGCTLLSISTRIGVLVALLIVLWLH